MIPYVSKGTKNQYQTFLNVNYHVFITASGIVEDAERHGPGLMEVTDQVSSPTPGDLMCSTHPAILGRAIEKKPLEGWRGREASCGLGGAWIGYREVTQSSRFGEN